MCCDIMSLIIYFLSFLITNAFIITNKEVLTNAVVCSSPSALAYNFTITLSTDTPSKNENVTTIFDFNLNEEISSGIADYSATLNGFGPYTSQAPLCDKVNKSGDSCPLVVGYHHQVSTSSSTVSGKLVTTIIWYDDSKREILCAKITTKTA